MLRRLTLVALIAAAMPETACRSGPKPDPIPDGVPGSYVYSASGSVLDKVTWAIDANLDLKPDGTFTLTLDKTMNGKRDSTARTNGTYMVSGDKIWIKESRDRPDNRWKRDHSLVIRPDSLLGEIGWKDHLVLRGIGVPDPVFVKRRLT